MMDSTMCSLKLLLIVALASLTRQVWCLEADEATASIRLDTETANLVSSLLKNSAERAAANAPIILNRNSQLFKNYQQQRLPRRADADPHNKISIFREDTEKITPKPYTYDGSTAYKPSTTPAPDVELNELNEVFSYKQYPDQDEQVESLEQQLLNFHHTHEAIKLPAPHQISKLPPIDSDLYVQPSDSLSHLNYESSYSLAGHFVHPRPTIANSKFPNFPHYQQPLQTSTTENYKTDFGYKVGPKPTEAVKSLPVTSTLPYRPPRPPTTPYTTTTSTTTTTTTTTTTSKPVIFKEYPIITKPLTHPVSVKHEPIISHTFHKTPSPPITVIHQENYQESPIESFVNQHHTAEGSSVHHAHQPLQHHPEPVKAYVEEPVENYYETEPVKPSFVVHEEPFHSHQPEPVVNHFDHDQYESPSNQETYNFVQHQPNKQQLAATTPHPLVFGFKPVASFVSSTLEGVFGGPKKPSNARPFAQQSRFPKPPLPPPPPPFSFRQPKFFQRQPYQQQGPSKPIRFPLGFFYH